MKNKLFLISNFYLFTFIVLVACAKEPESVRKYNAKKNLTVVFYNVENLFDTLNQLGERDGEFTPTGKNKWTTERYDKKINDIAQVLSNVNKNELPELIGLCEIENRQVLDDLVKAKALKPGKYAIAHFESPDYRGIDCALLYRPDEFTVISKSPVRVIFADDPDYSTRDILYVKGELRNHEALHVFVNHWPSRVEGLEQTQPKRLETARILKQKIDSVLQNNSAANILVMGDMNDEPSNRSLNDVLEAKSPETKNAQLLNLMYPVHQQKGGSYNYRGNWNMLDNMIVSVGLLDKKGFSCIDKQGFVFSEKWMQNLDKNGVMYPNRTYGGPNYYGGVSDHFPVYLNLSLQ